MIESSGAECSTGARHANRGGGRSLTDVGGDECCIRVQPPGMNGRLGGMAKGAVPSGGLRQTFVSLRHPNFIKFFTAQAVSMTGNWMQSVALAWLVLQLTRSPTWLGFAVALQFLPVLLFAPYGGVVVDRLPKRELLIATQLAFALLAALLGVVTIAGRASLPAILGIEIAIGVVSAVDSPARAAFIRELVPREEVANAVTLNSVMANATRAIGPAFAGILIATVSIGVCFLANAVSFVVVTGALLFMNRRQLRVCPPVAREPGQFRAGLRFVRSVLDLRVGLLMMAVVGTLTYEFSVVLPSLVDLGFGDSAQSLGWMLSAMGLGAIVGGVITASRPWTGIAAMTTAAAVFGLSYLPVSLAPSVTWATVNLFFVGAASVWFMSTANATVQLAAPGPMRGRVMALWTVAMVGSTTVGGPLMGWVANVAGPRWAVAAGALAALAAAVIGWVGLLREVGDNPGGSATLAPRSSSPREY